MKYKIRIHISCKINDSIDISIVLKSKKYMKIRVRTGIWGPDSESHARSLLLAKRNKKKRKIKKRKSKKNDKNKE